MSSPATVITPIRKPPREALAQLEKVVIEGNLAVLTPQERIGYYARVCESLGLNPLTRPFEYITLNGKLVLYARKDATDQLRSLKGVSIDRLERERDADLAIVTAYGHDRSGRTDSAIGAVTVTGLKGEALANAIMKAETKAKRRLTLSLAGLGWLDESESVDMPVVQVSVDPTTGEVEGGSSKAAEVRQRLTTRAEALRQGDVQDEPNDLDPAPPEPPKAKRQAKAEPPPGDVPPPEPEPEPEPALDVDSIPFDSGAAAVSDDPDPVSAVVAAAPIDAAPEATVADEAVDASLEPASGADDGTTCPHPPEWRETRESGVVCTECGTILASYGGAPRPSPVAAAAGRQKGAVEGLMARLHLDRTHDEVKAIASAVLGLDPEGGWSMANLFEDDLRTVLAAVRQADEQRRSRSTRPVRQAAAAGGSRGRR